MFQTEVTLTTILTTIAIIVILIAIGIVYVNIKSKKVDKTK